MNKKIATPSVLKILRELNSVSVRFRLSVPLDLSMLSEFLISLFFYLKILSVYNLYINIMTFILKEISNIGMI